MNDQTATQGHSETHDSNGTEAEPGSASARAIDTARSEGRAALIGYLPAGYPTKEESIAAGIALADNGVDIIEIGIPYSDPVMDGPVIQQATAQVLGRGFRMDELFEVVSAITQARDVVVLVMTYYNLIDRMGADTFAERLHAAGGAGAITPDLIPDEAHAWIVASDRFGLDRVFLSAPTSSPQRVKAIAEASRGFVYGVSLMGVTGQRANVSSAAKNVVEAAQAAGAARVCVGLGVSSAEHVREIAAYAHGVIVGTALVARLGESGVGALGELTAELRAGTAVAPS